MPGILISVYLTDEEHRKYVNNKTMINAKAREEVKKVISKLWFAVEWSEVMYNKVMYSTVLCCDV